jgi:hypothetical protein
MTRATIERTDRMNDDDRLNERFQTLLREAAQKREGRARTQLTEDAVAAGKESAALLDLARSRRQERRPGKLIRPSSSGGPSRI